MSELSKNTNKLLMSLQKKKIKKTTLTSIDGKMTKTSEVYYDDFGHNIKQINFSINNKIASTIIKTYDKNGTILSKRIEDKTLIKSEQIINWTYENSFNHLQQLQKIIAKQSDITICQAYLYNDDNSYQITTKIENETTTIEQYNSNNKLVSIINIPNNTQGLLSYDSNDNLIEHKEIKQGKPIQIIHYKNEYDSANRISTITTGNINIKYDYNDNGDISKETHKQQDGKITLTIYYDYEYK